jgi:hypothetical protein
MLNLSGQQFDRLTVRERGPHKGRHTQWYCDCVCGTTCLVTTQHLRSGRTRSCGCLRRENSQDMRYTHRMTGTPEYYAWNNMRKRCLDPTGKSYANYGGRGITICDAWLDSFDRFYADLGPRPGPGYTVERRDNNLGYHPDNCSWETRKVQARNTRTNRLVTLNGRTATLTEWLETAIVSKATVYRRLNRGWSIEHALTTPP